MSCRKNSLLNKSTCLYRWMYMCRYICPSVHRDMYIRLYRHMYMILCWCISDQRVYRYMYIYSTNICMSAYVYPHTWMVDTAVSKWGFRNYIYMYVYIYHHQHVVPPTRISLTSLANSPNRSSILAGLLGYILYPHRAAVCMFGLVVLLLLGYMWGSIGVHHLWGRPCFSSSVLHVWFI